jgi:winged helix-turn-helix protein
MKFVQDLGANFHSPTILLGENLGPYRPLAGYPRMTSVDLAEATRTSERYVRKWLLAQPASGYVSLHQDVRLNERTCENGVVGHARAALRGGRTRGTRPSGPGNRLERRREGVPMPRSWESVYLERPSWWYRSDGFPYARSDLTFPFSLRTTRVICSWTNFLFVGAIDFPSVPVSGPVWVP